MNFTIPKAGKIVITRHAQKRFLERFRLYFSKAKISSRYMWDNLMIAQITQGRVCTKWCESPFYKNKHGNTIVIKRNPCYYVCKPKDDKLIVVTVVPRWFND
jgi:hypothetical protein